MSLKELLSKRKAELVTLAKKFRLRGVFQLSKEALARRIATATEKEKATAAGTPRKRARGMRSISRRRSKREGLPSSGSAILAGGASAAAGKTVAVSAARAARRGQGSSAALAQSVPATAAGAKREATQAAASVLVHRFELPDVGKQQLPAEDLGELPESYGTGRLFLTARDPYWLYTYWDYSRQQMHDFRRQARDGTVYLRVCDVTGLDFNGHNAPVAQEVGLDPNARDWYIHVGRAGRQYVAQLGFYEPGGRFRVVSTSRVASTPADQLSADTTARFVTIPIEIPFSQLVELVRQFLREGGQLADVLARLQEEGYPLPFPVGQEGRWTKEQQEAMLRALGSDLLQRIQSGSFEVSEWLRRRLLQEMGSAAISSLFSPFGASWGRPRGFWLKVNAELIIHGATERDARVTIGGKAVRLRPDGTFSFQMAFPDGAYALPVEAVSADGSERRAVTLEFRRGSRDRRGEVGEVTVGAAIRSPAELTQVH